jgi:hypothetical protein
LHEGEWIWNDTGTNKIVLSTSDVDKIDVWGFNEPAKTPYMYEIIINDVPTPEGGLQARHTYTVTPGKSFSDSFDDGSNSDESF